MSEGYERTLPRGWTTAKLDDLLAAPIVYGILQPGPDVSNGVPYIRPTEIDGDVILVEQLRRTTPAIAARYERSKITTEDVILSIVGTIGKVALVPPAIDGANITQSSARVRVNSQVVLPRFVAWALRSPLLRQQFDKARLGTAVPRLNIAHVRDLDIPLAPFAQQQRLVDVLEELMSDLDAGVKALEGVRAKLKQYRTAVLKAAVEGTLTAEWRKAHPDVEPASELLKRILAERRRRWEEAQLKKYKDAEKGPPKNWKAKYEEPSPPDIGKLVALRGGWCWASVEQLGETTTGTTPSTNEPQYFGGDLPFFKPNDLDAGYNVRESFETLTELGAIEARVLPELSVLVTCIGATIGKTGLARRRCATNQQINALTVIPDLMSPEFVFWVFSSPFGQMQIIKNASATTLPILNKARFRALPIPVPPLREQSAIVDLVEDQLSVIDHLESDLDAKLRSAQALRQSILKAAFEGKLVPQDPNAEPASELLKRIAAGRAERERLAKEAKKAAKPAKVRRPKRGQNTSVVSAG